MTEKPEDAFRKKLQRARELTREYNSRTPEEQVKGYNVLVEQKHRLAERLSDLEIDLITIETLPAVVEERVRRNQIATALLIDVETKGTLDYKQFMQELGENHFIGTHTLLFLERVGYLHRDGERYCLTDQGKDYLKKIKTGERK